MYDYHGQSIAILKDSVKVLREVEGDNSGIIAKSLGLVAQGLKFINFKDRSVIDCLEGLTRDKLQKLDRELIIDTLNICIRLING